MQLAVAELDLAKQREELEQEKLKVEALKWELARVQLHHAT